MAEDLMDLTGFLTPLVTKLTDLIPDPLAKANALAAANTEMLTFVTAQNTAQTTVNAAEASDKSLFVAGWRPFVGWTCGVAFAFNFVAIPLLGTVGVHVPPLPTDTLMAPLMGMLGLGGMRTYEKVTGVSGAKKLK